jgi:hypothetical protein
LEQEVQKAKEAAENQRKLEDEAKQKQKEEMETKMKLKQAQVAQQLESIKTVDENNKMGISASTLEEYERNQRVFATLRSESDQALSAPNLKMFKFDLQKVDFILKLYKF